MKYLICGFSGAGKTHKLHEIKASEKYKGYQFFDLDERIFESHKIFHKDLGEIIDDKGWEWFRKTEQLVLFELLKIDNVWISLGGGTLNDKTCEKLSVIDDLQIFWLDATFDQCWQRIQNDKSRPMSSLGHDKLQELYAQRAEIYKNYPKLNLKL